MRLHILLFYVVSTLQRCSTALLFGLFHFSYLSGLQMGLLMALHALFVAYLLAARPYASWLLLAADLLAYLVELTVLVAAAALQRNPAHVASLGGVLVACYFVDIAVMIVPELLRYGLMAWAWVQARRSASAPAAAQPPQRTASSSAGAFAGPAHAAAIVSRQSSKVGGAALKQRSAGVLAPPPTAVAGDGVLTAGQAVQAAQAAAAANAAGMAALRLRHED
jgi:hypothetical protein